MDAYGLKEKFTKGLVKAAVGIGLAGALVGGAVVYISSHSSGNHPAGGQSVQQNAPAPK
jgi:hypothetical protein